MNGWPFENCWLNINVSKDPWDLYMYIYLNGWLMFYAFLMGKYTSPMDPTRLNEAHRFDLDI